MINIPDSIFPQDEFGKSICPKCKNTVNECSCKSYDPNKAEIDKSKVKVTTDKKNRSGKIVTVVSGLPQDEGFLKELCKQLKSKTGSGGTYYIKETGMIEIQGNKIDTLKNILNMNQ